MFDEPVKRSEKPQWHSVQQRLATVRHLNSLPHRLLASLCYQAWWVLRLRWRSAYSRPFGDLYHDANNLRAFRTGVELIQGGFHRIDTTSAGGVQAKPFSGLM